MERRYSGQIKRNADPALLHGRLQEKPGQLGTLLELVHQISAIDEALSQWLGDPTQTTVRVANLRDETLVLFSNNAAATTRLRYERESLLTHLREQHGFEVRHLEIRVKPTRRTK